MTLFHTIASGSSGNAALFSDGGVHILIDMGISCRRTVTALAQLGVRPEELSAILITHEHTDHIQGLATYIKKYRTPILCSPGTARQLRYRLAGVEPLLRTVPLGGRERCGHVEITLLPTCHDCRESSAFRLDTGDTALGYLTDTGCIPEETASALLGCQLLVLESNHDVEWLRSGPYPYYLKERILGAYGHLSNDDAARFAVEMAQRGTREIVLAHLSRENNTPARALDTVQRALDAADCTVRLSAAPRCEVCRYEVEVLPCRK